MIFEEPLILPFKLRIKELIPTNDNVSTIVAINDGLDQTFCFECPVCRELKVDTIKTFRISAKIISLEKMPYPEEEQELHIDLRDEVKETFEKISALAPNTYLFTGALNHPIYKNNNLESCVLRIQKDLEQYYPYYILATVSDNLKIDALQQGVPVKLEVVLTGKPVVAKHSYRYFKNVYDHILYFFRLREKDFCYKKYNANVDAARPIHNDFTFIKWYDDEENTTHTTTIKDYKKAQTLVFNTIDFCDSDKEFGDSHIDITEFHLAYPEIDLAIQALKDEGYSAADPELLDDKSKTWLKKCDNTSVRELFLLLISLLTKDKEKSTVSTFSNILNRHKIKFYWKGWTPLFDERI